MPAAATAEKSTEPRDAEASSRAAATVSSGDGGRGGSVVGGRGSVVGGGSCAGCPNASSARSRSSAHDACGGAAHEAEPRSGDWERLPRCVGDSARAWTDGRAGEPLALSPGELGGAGVVGGPSSAIGAECATAYGLISHSSRCGGVAREGVAREGVPRDAVGRGGVLRKGGSRAGRCVHTRSVTPDDGTPPFGVAAAAGEVGTATPARRTPSPVPPTALECAPPAALAVRAGGVAAPSSPCGVLGASGGGRNGGVAPSPLGLGSRRGGVPASLEPPCERRGSRDLRRSFFAGVSGVATAGGGTGSLRQSTSPISRHAIGPSTAPPGFVIAARRARSHSASRAAACDSSSEAPLAGGAQASASSNSDA